MRIEKEKRKVRLTCSDCSSISGFVHINPGERVIDFLNNEKDKFIAITEAESFDAKGRKVSKSKGVKIINKTCIKSIEEI